MTREEHIRQLATHLVEVMPLDPEDHGTAVVGYTLHHSTEPKMTYSVPVYGDPQDIALIEAEKLYDLGWRWYVRPAPYGEGLTP